jgi:hypothetical protein
MRSIQTRRQHRKPRVEDLEARSLLSTMAMPDMTPRNHAVEVSRIHINARRVTSILQLVTSTPKASISTIPANGDLNPYGVAFVPNGFAKGGALQAGDVLVSNFNGKANLQGTGTTIVRITPQGSTSTFFHGSPGIGLTAALGVLKRGFVVVGSLPTTDGTSATVQAGSIIVVDRNGNQVANLTNGTLINGPWDMAISDKGSRASVFVSNALSGSVVRFDVKIAANGSKFQVLRAAQIASGYLHKTDPAALVIGPTGLAYDAKRDILYVASTGDNKVFAIAHAGRVRSDQGMGTPIFTDQTHLHGPIGLALASNGNLIAANADGANADSNQPSEIVEFTPKGQFVSQFSLGSMPAAPFGIALRSAGRTQILAAANDNTNQLEIFSGTAAR